MKTRCAIIISAIFSLSLLVAVSAYAEGTKDYSASLAQIKLPVPTDPQVREYLGLKQGSGQFTLSQVNADILIIEVFSMYCPYCQKHAPMTNKLYQEIQARKDLNSRVKFIGLGISNSAYEVDVFRKKYAIAFPLFDDKGWAILNSLPGIRTPHYFALRKAGSSQEEFFEWPGPFSDEKDFLETIVKKSGIRF
jgi:hypothetical protein